jgi:hypothetical protein
MYIGRNRSGIDSGCIDYGIFLEKFDRMSVGDLDDALNLLLALEKRILARVAEIQGGGG